MITYVEGDATHPVGDGPKVIAHVCNDIGAWGAGFVLAVSRRWAQPERAYRDWHSGAADPAGRFELGAVQFVLVESQTWVANMIGQRGIRRGQGVPPVRYEAIQAALERVAEFASEHEATVHMPRIACGLAGGTWDQVVPIIDRTLTRAAVACCVYDQKQSHRTKTTARTGSGRH